MQCNKIYQFFESIASKKNKKQHFFIFTHTKISVKNSSMKMTLVKVQINLPINYFYTNSKDVFFLITNKNSALNLTDGVTQLLEKSQHELQ